MLKFTPASTEKPDVHPLRSFARVLLTSVFGPYGQDDEYGSRRLNPMELYHNQVTRTQGPFSLRMFHRSWGLMMIQANISAPCVLLDFPTLDRFVQEITEHQYDIIGISSIGPNRHKVAKMCQLIRQYQPEARIVVGGHIAGMSDLQEHIDADYIVKGEGVRWFRSFLGENPDQAYRHPIVVSGIMPRSCGIQLSQKPGRIAATLIPSVGCPMGCNFCATSAFFGGQGQHVDFYATGDELFFIMDQLEHDMKVQSFFVMDENFLANRKRAFRLLEKMEKYDKSWSLYVFSSANVVRSYDMQALVRMGVSWIWMGIEGKDSQYPKLSGADTFSLVRKLQANGIRVLGSTIIGLENHTPENIDQAIEFAVRHDTDFHQFMLYTPVPGTRLHGELTAQGRMKDPAEYDVADIHGQFGLNYRHWALSDEQASEAIVRAFDRDFEINGPSIVRIARTTLAGWLKHKNDQDFRVRDRFTREASELRWTMAALLGAAKWYYRKSPVLRAEISSVLKQLHKEFGWKSRLASVAGGRWVLRQIHKEEKRLALGFQYEPPTFCEKNKTVVDRPDAVLCRYAEPTLSSVVGAALAPCVLG